MRLISDLFLPKGGALFTYAHFISSGERLLKYTIPHQYTLLFNLLNAVHLLIGRCFSFSPPEGMGMLNGRGHPGHSLLHSPGTPRGFMHTSFLLNGFSRVMLRIDF
jgi:hypothetical protein